MNDEINDELVTPGCANCALKHMSAAIAYTALDPVAGTDGYEWPAYAVYEARARINAVEFLEGYRSHLCFAVGLLEIAEETACEAGFPVNAKLIRSKRIALMSSKGDHKAVFEFIRSVQLGCSLMATAHVMEAIRELPADKTFEEIARRGLCMSNKRERHDAFRACVSRVLELYFPEDEEKKGGEETMAKGKMCAKKNAGSVKAVKAACKGGKAKKGCKK